MLLFTMIYQIVTSRRVEAHQKVLYVRALKYTVRQAMSNYEL